MSDLKVRASVLQMDCAEKKATAKTGKSLIGVKDSRVFDRRHGHSHHGCASKHKYFNYIQFARVPGCWVYGSSNLAFYKL